MLKKFIKNTSGATAVVAGVGAMTLGVATAVAIDFATLQSVKQKAQHVLDQSVLYASDYVDDTTINSYLAQGMTREAALMAHSDEIQDIAQSVFEKSFVLKGHQNLTVSLNIRDDNYIDASANFDNDVIFAGLLGHEFFNVNVESQTLRVLQSIVQAVPTALPATPPSNGSPCIMILDPSAPRTLMLNSEADIVAPECEVHVHTSAIEAMVINSQTTLDVKKACIAGSGMIDNGHNSIPDSIEFNCAVDPDLYLGVFPEPDSNCNFYGENYSGGTINLTPGVYCGSMNFNGEPTVNLAPGTYVIKDYQWQVSGGTWNGTGVTFYYWDKESKIQFNSNVNVNLSAPTSGSYEDVLMTERAGLGRSGFMLNDSDSFILEGIVYLPSRDVTMNSRSQITGRKMNLVVNQLVVNQSHFGVSPMDSSLTSNDSGQTAVTSTSTITETSKYMAVLTR